MWGGFSEFLMVRWELAYGIELSLMDRWILALSRPYF